MGNSNVSTIYNCYYLDGDIKDDNAIASLNQYMEENRNDVNYKVDIEYEEQTGLASYYVITLEEKE